MPGDLVDLPVLTRLDVPVTRVLEGVVEAEVDRVVVIGWDSDGELYFASSFANGPEILWLLELAKKELMEVVGGE